MEVASSKVSHQREPLERICEAEKHRADTSHTMERPLSCPTSMQKHQPFLPPDQNCPQYGEGGSVLLCHGSVHSTTVNGTPPPTPTQVSGPVLSVGDRYKC